MPPNKKIHDWKPALRAAIREAGSMQKLGKLTGFSHVAFHLALKNGLAPSSEMSRAVSRVTSVKAWHLRPDLWDERDDYETIIRYLLSMGEDQAVSVLIDTFGDIGEN